MPAAAPAPPVGLRTNMKKGRLEDAPLMPIAVGLLSSVLPLLLEEEEGPEDTEDEDARGENGCR